MAIPSVVLTVLVLTVWLAFPAEASTASIEETLPNSFGSNLNAELLTFQKWPMIVLGLIVIVAILTCCMASNLGDTKPGKEASLDQQAVAEPGPQPEEQEQQAPTGIEKTSPNLGNEAYADQAAVPEQPAPAGIDNQLSISPNPEVAPVTFISPRKRKAPMGIEFVGGTFQIYDGNKFHEADSPQKLRKLVSPTVKVEQPARRRLSFINFDGEVEEHVIDGDDDECSKKSTKTEDTPVKEPRRVLSFINLDDQVEEHVITIADDDVDECGKKSTKTEDTPVSQGE